MKPEMSNGNMTALLDMMDTDPLVKVKKKIKKRKKRVLPEAFPDYGKSLVSQEKGDPQTAGLIRGAGFGAVGAVLGALASRIASNRTRDVVLGSVLGGITGALPGYYSGKKEQESLNSKLLFLRRLGVDNPGELEAIETYPGLSRKLTEKGVKI